MFREFREIIRLVGPSQMSSKRERTSTEADKHGSNASPTKFAVPFRFLDLPPEVRTKVYKQLFAGASITIYGGEKAKVILTTPFNLDILQASHSVRNEALPVLNALATLNLLDKRPQHLIHRIPNYYLRGIRRIYLLPRLKDELNITDFPSLQSLLIFMSRDELFTQPKLSAEDYEDVGLYTDTELIADARAGLLNSGRHPQWLLGEVEKPKSERAYRIAICCTIWHRIVGKHLDLVSRTSLQKAGSHVESVYQEIKLDGGDQDMVIRKVQVWTDAEKMVLSSSGSRSRDSTEHDDNFM